MLFKIYIVNYICFLFLSQVIIISWNLSTFTRPMFSSYRNQSVDLFYKSTAWFLCDKKIGRLRVKPVNG